MHGCHKSVLQLQTGSSYHKFPLRFIQCCRWRISYWYGFIAQFTILPFHQEYADSGEATISPPKQLKVPYWERLKCRREILTFCTAGEFTVLARIGTAIKNNLIFYAILTVSFLYLHHSVKGTLQAA